MSTHADRCPLCGSPVAYVGAWDVVCKGVGCVNWKYEPKLKAAPEPACRCSEFGDGWGCSRCLVIPKS